MRCSRAALILAICWLSADSLEAAQSNRRKRQSGAPDFSSLNSLTSLSALNNAAGGVLKQPLDGINHLISSLGLSKAFQTPSRATKSPLPAALNFPTETGGIDFNNLQDKDQVNLLGISSGSIEGVAAIPVPGFPDPQDIPEVPGVNTIPGLTQFNYVVGQLLPQVVPATNSLLGGSLGRLLPQSNAKNIAKNIFKSLRPTSAKIDTDRMMGRWFQVINSPHVIREACTVSHFGALTNNTYSATFTILKFYRERNPNGPPRFALGYGFASGEDGQFVVHNSNSPDSEPFWVIKTGPLNSFNQYDYAIISNWVKFPVFVIARDAERFKRLHMRNVLQFLEDQGYINVLTKAFNMIAPVDYSECQYTPTFSSAG